MSNWFLRIAVLYIIAGVSLGIHMGASGDHSLYPLHAHLNLLGWVAMTLFGLFYRVVPAAAETKLAKVHFWIYVPAHFAQMVLLAALLRGNPAVEPVLGLFSTLVGVAFVCFAVLVWRHTGKAS
jgi:cbb3-type cytochrome oxidase subunit 1